MPTPVKLLGSSSDADYRVGEWTMSIETDEDFVKVSVAHGELAHAALGQSVTVGLRLELLPADGGLPISMTEDSIYKSETVPDWHESGTATYTGYEWSRDADLLSSLGTNAYRSTSRYRFTATLTRKSANNSGSSSRTPFSDKTKALRMASIRLRPTAANVRFVFPKEAEQVLELWAAEDSLIKCSPYFDDMLKSACAETIPRSAKRARSEAPEATSLSEAETPRAMDAPDQSPDWQDSDEEIDDFVRVVRKPTIHDLDAEDHDFEYRQITIKETAYSTYRAVLLYLLSGHIQFLQLRSSTAPQAPSKGQTRQEVLDEHEKKHPTLPFPVSPKSVYRLAHLLQHRKLQQMALESLASFLTVNGAAHELFSPVSIAYDDLRKVIIKFVVKNFARVRTTTAWKEHQDRGARGELSGQEVMVLTELLAAVYEASLPAQEG
ncbi:hypothetical protein JCM10908_007188 [Rhodotorula pacifica]|uniref:uncharacterized protein n=1 Tax=Rhodotorula pacifica TaxID=1495444 RepID=UPI003181E355